MLYLSRRERVADTIYPDKDNDAYQSEESESKKAKERNNLNTNSIKNQNGKKNFVSGSRMIETKNQSNARCAQSTPNLWRQLTSIFLVAKH